MEDALGSEIVGEDDRRRSGNGITACNYDEAIAEVST